MSIAGIGKTLQIAEHNIIKLIKDGCDLALGNYTQADLDKYDQDWKNLLQNTSSDTLDQAHSEAREAATNHLMSSGMSKSEAETWFENHWAKLKSSAEHARKTIPKVEVAGKHVWLKFIGGIVLVTSGAMFVSVMTDKPSADQLAMENTLRSEQAEAREAQLEAKDMNRFLISEDQFNIMTGGLAIAPTPVDPAAPIAAAAAPAPFPPAVAAIAAQPAKVEITTPSGTQEITSTVGRVYENVPERVQHEIEQSAPVPKIEHDYDHEDMNDCFHTHCLSPHKDFTVATDFASAHITY